MPSVHHDQQLCQDCGKFFRHTLAAYFLDGTCATQKPTDNPDIKMDTESKPWPIVLPLLAVLAQVII